MSGPHLSMSTRLVCWTPASPADAEERLHAAIARGELRGTVGDGGFDLTRPRSRRNSWRPQLRGRLRPHAGGTAITVDLGVSSFVLVFTAFHAVFFLGLTWLLGVLAFSGEVEGAIEALVQATGATVQGEDEVMALFVPADPRLPGSESAAPPSLAARIETDRVTFRVGDDEVRVDAHGVSVGGAVEIHWHDLARCRVSEGTLQLYGPADRLLALLRGDPEQAEEDLDWLAAWLAAQALRRNPSAADGDAQDRERERLGRLVRDVDR